MPLLTVGDRIIYTYWHTTGRYGLWRSKEGNFIRYSSDRTKALVQLDGNRKPAYKPAAEIAKL
jgi:hypothetical protein